MAESWQLEYIGRVERSRLPTSGAGRLAWSGRSTDSHLFSLSLFRSLLSVPLGFLGNNNRIIESI